MLGGATPAPLLLIVHFEFFCLFRVDKTCLKLYPLTIVHPTFPCKHIIIYLLFDHFLLVEGSQLIDIVLFFGATYAITLFIDSFFLCQTYALTLLKLCLFETGKESFSGDCIVDCRFVCNIIHRLCSCMSFLILVILS